MKNRKLLDLAIIVSSLVLGFWSLNVQAATPTGPQVQVQPGFYDQYKEYLKNMPAPTPFNGGAPPADLKSVTPFYRMPFTVFKLDISAGSQQSYQAGDTLSLKTNLSYAFKGVENNKKIYDACMAQLKDDSKCTMPAVYKIPEFDDLGVYIQIWKKDNSQATAKNGDFLVDEFYALEKQDLATNNNNSKDFNINWKIPSGQSAGNYYALIFLNQAKSFDLLGTPLAPYSESKRFDFDVKGDQAGNLEINKDNIKVNSAPYAYRKPAPSVSGQEIKIEVPIKNNSKSLEDATVKYELYRWGRINPADQINSKTESKSLAAGASDILTYSFNPNDTDSAYDLKITVNTANSKTMTYVRFVIDGKNRGIFRFLNMVEDGGSLTPMFCIRNAAWSGNFPGKVRLTLGNQIWEKQGTFEASEGNCFVLNDAKMKVNPGSCSQLKGEILDQNGKVVDTKIISSSCQTRQGQNLTSENKKLESSGRIWEWVLGILVCVALVVIILIYLNNKKTKLNP